MDKTKTATDSTAPDESIAFQAGRKARSMGTLITKSALRMIRPGSRQYDDFIDGYEYETARRSRSRNVGKKARRKSEASASASTTPENGQAFFTN